MGRKVYEYDLKAASATRTIDLPTTASLAVYCVEGCYYLDNREDHWGIFFYQADTGETVRIDPAGTAADAKQIHSGGMGEIIWDEYDTLLSDHTLYVSAYAYAPGTAEISNAGVFCYDPEEGHALRLGDIPARFTQAQSGDYCMDIATGDVYALENHSMTEVGTLPLSEDQPEFTLVDVLEDTVYYHNKTALYALDTRRGNARELYRVEESGYEIQGAYLRDWVLYYWTLHQTADPEIFALDLNTGERRKLDFFPSRPLYRFDNIAFYEDGIFVSAGFYDVSGYSNYWLNYDGREAQALAAPEDIGQYGIGPISRDGDTLYWKHWHPEQDDCYQVAVYDLKTDTIQSGDMELPKPSDQLRVYDGGCYYIGESQEASGIFHYDLSTGKTTLIALGGDTTELASSKATQADKMSTPLDGALTEEMFFSLFPELDEASMRAYLDAHPEALDGGWGGINIDESGLEDAGTSIRTTNGDQVLAVNAGEGILLIRVTAESNTRGVLAICKDTSRLRLCAAETLGTTGQTVAAICQNNQGILAMTGSAFVDTNGDGNGGALSGLMVSGGEIHGSALGSGYKRLELREDDRMYIVDSTTAVNESTREAVEFQPAAIVDGEIVVDETWNGFNPRALIGQSERLETMMLVMEGRFTDSVGCGVEACAEILEQYGCVQAMNLDGGTSAILYYDGKCVTRCSNPELPDGRMLPSAWVYGGAE